MAPRWANGYGVQVRHEYRFSDEVLDGDDEISNPLDRERTVHTTWLEAIYTFRREVRATIKIPVVHQERVSNIGGRAVRSDGTGLGDIILGLPLRKYWNHPGWTTNLGFTPSVRVPTGSTRDGYPVGDGSTDVGVSLSWSAENFRLYSLVDLFYWKNGSGGNGIRPGDELGLDVNLGLHPWHDNATNTGFFVMLDLEARRLARGRDDLGFVTGGDRLSLGPILVGYRDNWMARAEAKFPVWEDVRGTQVSRGIQFQLGIGGDLLMRRDSARNTSVLGLSILGATCCALPATLVALGAGGAVASMASTVPWLIGLSKYKAVTFGATGAALAWAWWQAGRAEQCDVSDAPRLRRQRRILAAATALLGVSIFVAYALLPLTVWWEGRGGG